MFAEDERERLGLIHHYTLHTTKSISDLTEAEAFPFWGKWAVELVFTNDFLHGIINVSALHPALIGFSPQKNTILATHHHDIGVGLFRPHPAHLTMQSQDPAFAFTCIIVYALGIQQLSESIRGPISKILKLLLTGMAIFHGLIQREPAK
ncbi:uncharacterized protein APUU_21988S [Aspergillus puulaauensis]|uniref:Uncharacterized protein n=1 Tax=Aspergillus puulaauensis TaxID=1220207 RepID=A0A7R7XHI7_9EURO|nr:uncharacterized protein APUU_21988S [Aspergillus puulaauensis]BCS21556.1 hypothetical protein APUU_21988S [Aspergillus puulaauensis]